MDRYLWSRRPTALSAELEAMEEREREERKRKEVGEQIPSDVEWRQSLEDGTRHWGVRVTGGTSCGVCCYPLSHSVSPNNPGLLLFQCGILHLVCAYRICHVTYSPLLGHAYHRHCLPEMACYICFKKNMTENFSTLTSFQHKK